MIPDGTAIFPGGTRPAPFSYSMRRRRKLRSMYCTKCGVELQEKDYFCSHCGTATAKPRECLPGPPKHLMRSRYNKKIAGVCGGFAEYLEVDPTLVRVIWLALAFLPFPGAILAYIVAWIAMPMEPYRIGAAPGQYVQTPQAYQA